jgi:hypothetical protein
MPVTIQHEPMLRRNLLYMRSPNTPAVRAPAPVSPAIGTAPGGQRKRPTNQAPAPGQRDPAHGQLVGDREMQPDAEHEKMITPISASCAASFAVP